MRGPFEKLVLDQSAFFVGGINDGEFMEVKGAPEFFRVERKGKPERGNNVYLVPDVTEPGGYRETTRRPRPVVMVSYYHRHKTTSGGGSDAPVFLIYVEQSLSFSDALFRILNYFSDNRLAEVLKREIHHRKLHGLPTREHHNEEKKDEPEPPRYVPRDEPDFANF